MRRPDSCVDRGQHVVADHHEVDLVASPITERGQQPLAVVAAAIEAPIDGPLDPVAERREEGGRDQRRAGHREGAAACQRLEDAAQARMSNTKAATSSPVTIAQLIVRLISRSISYSR